MLTEAEAKTKVCCGPPQTVNGKNPLFLCVGSACMAWHAIDAKFEEIETDLGQMPPGLGWVQIERGDSWGLRWRRPQASAGGYCGLAGRPE